MGIVLLYVFILRAEDSGSLSGPLVDCVCWRVCPEEKWEPTANAPPCLLLRVCHGPVREQLRPTAQLGSISRNSGRPSTRSWLILF